MKVPNLILYITALILIFVLPISYQFIYKYNDVTRENRIFLVIKFIMILLLKFVKLHNENTVILWFIIFIIYLTIWEHNIIYKKYYSFNLNEDKKN